MINKKVQISLANAIVEKLWQLGLLTDDERTKIIEKNKVSFF